MKGNPEERALKMAEYIAESGATVRRCAQIFGVSKSTVHKDLRTRLCPQSGSCSSWGCYQMRPDRTRAYSPSLYPPKFMRQSANCAYCSIARGGCQSRPPPAFQNNVFGGFPFNPLLSPRLV